ncbi:M16 family metallopeptidase [Micromonospora halophytica]|uniref:Predicted Zn-dependent peptidase n=1 Tax=Micromonospora halophytica TaxID=47864 RepID=A0A1C5IB13_9ACTN|nr:insulinase family protein [Micromonospora halophytica]SCG55602.1 Predicted Zn-dependent peptidase [Micromonospora halophytica]
MTTPVEFRPPPVESVPLGAAGGHLVVVPRPGELTEVRVVLPAVPVESGHTGRVQTVAEALRRHLGEALAGTADLRVESRPDRIVVSARALREDAGTVVRQVGAALAATALGELDLRRAAEAVRTRVAAGVAHPLTTARTAFLRAVYGSHPLAEEGADLAPDLSACAPTTVVRDIEFSRCSVVLVGGADTVAPVVRSAFEPVGAAATRPGAPAVVRRPAPRVGRVTDPRATGDLLRLGTLGPARDHADYPALQLATLMLGGYYASNLTRILREREGLSYAPRAVLDPVADAATLVIEVDVTSGRATEATGFVREAYDALSAAGAATALGTARTFAIGSMSLACSSRSGMASVLAGVLGAGLEPSWLAGYAERLGAVGSGTLSAALDRHWAWDRLAGVVVTAEDCPPSETSES